MTTIQTLQRLREKIVLVSTGAREGHIPSALSILNLLWVLYDSVLKISPFDETRDYFIMSKGHASIGLYVVLAEKNLIKKNELDGFASFNSSLGGHPDRNKLSYIEASTGSLGHGMPIGVGIALSKKINALPGNVYLLIGDGECNEGSIWEAALLGAQHQLSNICCIVDHNHSTDRALNIDSVEEKFSAFGWETLSIPGNDHEAIQGAFANFLSRKSNKPLCIIANTTKGYGIKIMENNPEWHHKTPSAEELKQILREIYV
jgi:transketolase